MSPSAGHLNLFKLFNSDDEDEERELMKELEKIRAEKEAARLAKQQEEQEDETVDSTNQEVLSGNPLLNEATFSMKRRLRASCVENIEFLFNSFFVGGTTMLSSKTRVATNPKKLRGL